MKKYEKPQIELIEFETEAIMLSNPIIPTPTEDVPGTGENQGPWA